MTAGLWSRMLDMVAPKRCAVCGGRLSMTEQTLCAACCLRLPRTGFWHSPDDNPVAHLFWGQTPTVRAASFFYFEPHSETSRMIYEMKYHGRPRIAFDMGRMAAMELAADGFFDGIDVIVPVPLSRRRQRNRGYNQSEMIARGMQSVTGIPVETNAVRRTAYKTSQTGLGRAERLDNVTGIFRLTDADCLRNRHVLLVDDIVTTGATVTACADAMRGTEGLRLSIMTLGYSKS